MAKRSDQTAILLLGNYRPAVVIARALAPLGYRIVLGLQGEEHGVRFSRFVSETWDHPELSRVGAFDAELKSYLHQNPAISCVLPVTEEFVNAFARQDICLPEGVSLASPNNEVVNTFADKVGALELAKSVGVSTLPFAIVEDYDDLIARAVAIGYPLTIRPLGTTARLFGRKALILANSRELRAELKAWPQGHSRLLLQRYAQGTRHNVYFAAQNGNLIGVSESKINRTNNLDGTGLAVDGQTLTPTPVLLEGTRRLVEETRYTGIGLAQFIVDPESGDTCFLELNPRVSGSHAVPERAGVPLSGWAVELAQADLRPDTVTSACTFGRTDIRYVWTSGDLLALKTSLMDRHISLAHVPGLLLKIARSAIGANTHMIWRWDDPLPAMATLLGCLPRFGFVRRMLSRRDAETVQLQGPNG
ncbi:MAG: hypothetical protein AAGF86_05190 [Pseudomonadota bacterium]